MIEWNRIWMTINILKNKMIAKILMKNNARWFNYDISLIDLIWAKEFAKFDRFIILTIYQISKNQK